MRVSPRLVTIELGPFDQSHHHRRALACRRTIADIEGAWVQEQKVVVNKVKVTEYRVSLKVTFVLDGGKESKMLHT